MGRTILLIGFLTWMAYGTDPAVGFAAPPGEAPPDSVPLPVDREAEPTLTIGSTAPPLDIETWMNPPKGEPQPLQVSFQKGHVYVVEFWATWCGPCVSSMPHLAELQRHYANRRVSVISVSDEDTGTIDQFLAQEVPVDLTQKVEGANARPITFRELTSPYRITSDPDQSSQRDYMAASGQDGIPTAFIVGKSGLVEWIGHPGNLDDVLASVVEDQWDREGYKSQLARQKRLEELSGNVLALLRKNDRPGAKKLIDNALAEADDPESIQEIKQLRLQVMLFLHDASAIEHARDIVETSTEPQVLDGLAWTIYKLHQEKPFSDELIELAVGSSQKALRLATDPERKALTRDTLAHLLATQGKTDEAIRMQELAIQDAAPELGRQLQTYLDELKAPQTGKEKEKVN